MAYDGTVKTNGANLMIRSGPSVQTSFTGRIPNGTKITIGEIVDKPGGWKWGKVTYNGASGWCCIVEPGAGNWVKLTEKKPPTPTPPAPTPTPPKETGPDINALANGLLKQQSTAQDIDKPDAISGSAVQYQNSRFPTTGISDVNPFDIMMDDTGKYISASGINDVNTQKFMQNKKGFPKHIGMVDGLNRYNYYMDHSDMIGDLESLAINENRGFKTRRESYMAHVSKYNRFKVANPENVLSKSFAHVFFVRPDLNILTHAGSGNFELTATVKNDSSLYYAINHCPEILKELTHSNDSSHDFMFMLSNAVNSFEVSDEFIRTDAYGESLTGFKIPIGKHNLESQASGTFNISYTDDRDFHIYHIHKIWTDYISSVFRGQIKARDQYIKNKIIDYASSVYYIVTAEDGETVLFWTKYYGVFPTNSPSSVTSWSKGNLLKNPEFTITYSYAFKEDFDPLTLVEFNTHSPKENPYKYVRSYEKALLGTGQAMVGAPFIETLNGAMDIPYTFKLRFRKGGN